jgi:adenylate cyclase
MRHDARRASLLATAGFIAAGLVLGGWLGLNQIRGVSSGLDRLENLTLDWRFLLAGPRAPPPNVVVVAIDDDTLAQAGGQLLSRETLARIVRTIAAGGPRVVALDMAFPDSRGADADGDLADALRSTVSVVASIGTFGADARAEASTKSQFALTPKPSEVLWPTNGIRDAAETGLANISTDASGVPRFVPMIFEPPEGVVPSFALAAVAAALKADPILGPDRIELGNVKAETDLGYHLPIRFYGPAGSFPRVSAAKLLSGDIAPALFRDRLVVLGVTAQGLGDTFATPFDRVVPGAEIFATAIANLVSGGALERTWLTRRIDAATAAALPAALIAFIAMRRAAIGLALAALILLLWAIAVFFAFTKGYWLGMAAPLAASAPLVMGYTAARFLLERQEGRRAAADKSLLARFQSPLILEAMLRNPAFLAKPVRQDVAVMFIDLSGFTRAAETMGPEGSRDLLSDMQTLVEREVSAHQGVVIAYMGDGVLAAFGLPAPRHDDAARALLGVESLRAAVSEWVAGLPAANLDFRIGAHFGPAVVSRLGSPSHQHITVTGDTVNAASRLLEVAKLERRRVVVTEDLFLAARAGLGPGRFDEKAYTPLTVAIRGRAALLRVRMRS